VIVDVGVVVAVGVVAVVDGFGCAWELVLVSKVSFLKNQETK